MSLCMVEGMPYTMERRDFKSLLHSGVSMLEVAERFDEVEAPDLEAFALVEAVRGVIGGVAIEHLDVAVRFLGEGVHVFHERGGHTLVAVIWMHNEIVHFHVIAAPKFRAVPNAGEPDELTIDEGS